jgi:hypothetical protein
MGVGEPYQLHCSAQLAGALLRLLPNEEGAEEGVEDAMDETGGGVLPEQIEPDNVGTSAALLLFLVICNPKATVWLG